MAPALALALALTFSQAWPGQGGILGHRGESTYVYGNIDVYAYYFVDLLVGEPEPQRVSVIIDTGSSLCGFPCDRCQHCGHHLEPLFRFGDSVTASPVTCGPHDDDCDGECKDGMCSYMQSYAEGSSVSGFFFRDSAMLADALRPNRPVTAMLGCHTDERKLFHSQWVNGIMGLAPRKEELGGTTVLTSLFRQAKAANFSMCLSEWGGILTVGGLNADYHTSGISWLSMQPLDYYRVQPQQMRLGRVSGVAAAQLAGLSGLDFGEAIVDSGTTYVSFPQKVASLIFAALREACANAACAAELRSGAGLSGVDCWELLGDTSPVHFPALDLIFVGGGEISWPASRYLRANPQSGLWCPAFEARAEGRTVLGLSFLLGKDFIFDLRGRRIGVADASCPERRRAPDEARFQRGLLTTSTATANKRHILLATSMVLLMLSLALFGYACYGWSYDPPREQGAREGVAGSLLATE